MTSGPIGLDLAEVSKANAPQVTDVPAAPGPINEKNEKHLIIPDHSSPSVSDEKDAFPDADGKEYPTPEEVDTLRRVCGTVPWSAYTIAFVELCERFSYYGTTVVCKYDLNHEFLKLGGDESANREGQSSTLSKIHYQKDQPLANQAPMDSQAH